LLNQIGHFRSLVKSGCDAADFIFDIPSLDWREMPGTMIVKGVPWSPLSKKAVASAFAELVTAAL
jgi:hypothetical protein